MGAGLELGVLGPIEVRIDHGEPVALGGVRQRALLAILGLHANEVVSTDRLVDDLWGEHPPATAVHTVQVFVSRLRRALASAGERLVTRPRGYVLEVGPDEVDASRCERLYGSARAALTAGNAAEAAALLRDAQALWRGPPLVDFTYEPFAQAMIARLEELRLSCREELIEAELALGRHAEVVSELEALVREQPLRERPRGQLMLALYRCGRQAEALDVFQQTRRLLVEELAVEPGRLLRELEQSILRQDPALQGPAEAMSGRTPRASQEGINVLDHTPGEAPVLPTETSPAVMLRKTMTVIIAQLSAMGGVDPEVARSLIAAAREEAKRIIGYHGGTFVSGLAGEVVGIFGLPLIREDDALRALRAAKELCARVAALGASQSCRLVARVGVDTGEVVAEAPDDIFGEPLNRAISLTRAANDGEVLLSETTLRFTSGAVRTDPALDGRAWRLLSVLSGVSALERRLGSPMVDRVSELSLARAAFSRAASSGAARLLTVVGEPGIGKSRLACELSDQLRGEATVLSGHCLSYGDGIAFWPLREALDQIAGGDSRDEIRGVLDDADDADLIADIIAATFGMSGADPVSELVPWAFRRLLEALAHPRPLQLVIEDAHWAEPPLLDLVDYLVDWVNAPVLLLCTARPELLDERPAWGGGRPQVSSIVLGPLSDGDALSLLENKSGQRPLSPAERAQILETGEGNPLFVEQLLAMSEEDPWWDSERPIPATIQALLAARLDRLGPGERAFIQRAAIIGREFWPSAVVELLPDEARSTADQHLRALVHRGLIHPDRSLMGGEEQLRFHHILIRDVAYRSTPKALRSELHERFADWLAPRDDALEEFVGFHLEQAFRYRTELGYPDAKLVTLAVRAADSLAVGGRKALLRGDTSAALKLLRSSADLFDAGGRTRPDVLLDLGNALSESGDLRDADRVLRAAYEAARTTRAEAVGARASIELSALRALVDPSARVEETQAVAERAMEVFRRVGDEAGLARAWLEVADVHWTRCHVAESEQVLERALKHADRAGVSREQSRILGDLARAAVVGPRPVEDAIRRCNAILERAGDDVILSARTETMVAVLEAMDGRFDEARARWRRIQRRLEDVGLSVTASLLHSYRALIELMSEVPANVEPELAQACAVLQTIGERSRLGSIAGLLARLLYRHARYDEAERYIQITADAASEDDLASQVLWRGTRAKLLARAGETPLAEEMAGTAVALAEETDFLMLRGDVLCDRAEALTTLNRPELAAPDLEVAISLYDRKGVRTSAEAARRSLRSLAAGSAAPLESAARPAWRTASTPRRT